MKGIKWAYLIIRAAILAIVCMAILAPLSVYVLLSIPSFQQKIAQRAEQELSQLLGTQVKIGKVQVAPFNRVTVQEVVIKDDFGKPSIHAAELGAGIDLSELIFSHKIVITYAEIMGLKASLYRQDPKAPLNIQNIITKLTKKEPGKPPTKYDLAINMALIRGSEVSYDILSAPRKGPEVFDPSHIHVTGLKADLNFPRIKNGLLKIDVRRLVALETSGLTLKNLTGNAVLAGQNLAINDLTIQLPNSSIAFNPLSVTLGKKADDTPIDLSFKTPAELWPADFKPFMPKLAEISEPLTLDFMAQGTADSLNIRDLTIEIGQGNFGLSCQHLFVSGLLSHKPQVKTRTLKLLTSGDEILKLGSKFITFKEQPRTILSKIGTLELNGDFALSKEKAVAAGVLKSSLGTINFQGDCLLPSEQRPLTLKAEVSSPGLRPEGIIPHLSHLESIQFSAKADVTVNHKDFTGTASVEVPAINYQGKTLTNVTADASMDQGKLTATLSIDDRAVDAVVDLEAELNEPLPHFLANGTFVNLDLDFLGVKGKLGQQHVSTLLDAEAYGKDIDHGEGQIVLKNLTLTSTEGTVTDLGDIELTVTNDADTRQISLTSSLINGTIAGDFAITRIPANFKHLLSQAFPALIQSNSSHAADEDYMAWNFTLKNDTILAPLLPLPVSIIEEATIRGHLDERVRAASLTINAPYLRKKNKLIENTQLSATINDGVAKAYFGTEMGSKFGPMHLSLDLNGHDDAAKASIGWEIDNKAIYGGSLDLAASFAKEPEGNFAIDAEVLPSDIVINDTVWKVHPAQIDYNHKRVSVQDFRIDRENQFISIDGHAGPSPEDYLMLRLKNIDLDYVFETLNIPNVSFGGVATGELVAANLFSPTPYLATRGQGLQVDNISYNHCLMGNAMVRSAWHPDHKAVSIDADIHQPWNGGNSEVHGLIMPMSEELDFHFRADRTPVGFMKPFMAAFTSNVTGEVSGEAHLYGTFALLDMTGKVYAKDLAMKLDFTNTVYTTSDSVFMTPGLIKFDNVTLHDRYGQSAKVSGYVTHKYFKEPTFKFNITDAQNMLVYDVPRNDAFPWYGRIFGTGSATVTGVPGLVDIKVAMNTSKGVKNAGSDFTFMISDAESAEEYNFITFHDRDQAKKDSLKVPDNTPEIVKLLRHGKKKNEDHPSVYRMDFNIGVNPEACINLVMDPIGGDVIKTYGNGHLRMTYASNGELEMFGDYVLSRGSYLFTLQDIFKKQFTIRPGSSISFDGDPYAARLNITGQYEARANLTDLDESFATDRDLKSTTVNVQALLKVTGDMRQPDISFDLDFPLMTQDVKRKVRSIVSTEDMMNRQILYLLAMNRFFTPEYMNASKGNELVSMASSTLSSQLSTMLGQLGTNWTIAPQFRSDRGDFSDMEVDVALSSHLLNNRLLLNGNFGYRDKSLNNNSFIGDFDIQYLLNRSGSISLKAYNRYNDQSYYLKNALTTQGVGIVFKRDFDDLLSFLKPWRKKKKKTDEQPEEMPVEPTVPQDSLLKFK